LPHLNIHVRDGRLLRAYEPAGKLSNLFDPRFTWLFERPPRKPRKEVEFDAETSESGRPEGQSVPASIPPPSKGEAKGDGKKGAEKGGKLDQIPCKIPIPPRVYVIETGYVFVVLGVKPVVQTLTSFQDFYAAVVRRGYNHLLPEHLPRRKAGPQGETKPNPLEAMFEEAKLDDTSLRHWLSMFIPEIMIDAPIGSWPNPMAVNVLYAESLPEASDRHRLRLAHGSDQPIDPSAGDCRIEGHPAMWEPSARELCLFSPVGVTWVVWPIDVKGQLAQFDAALLERYVYKWILVEHERLFLLELSSQCASMSNRPDGRIFGSMRLALLQYTAKFSFGHISSEERHDRFYCGLRGALDISGLFDEVKGEITEIDEYLSDKRADLLNQVLGFLTLVLTPVGLVIGIFERDTLPAFDFEFGALFGAGAWGPWKSILFHVPLWLLLLSAVVGLFLFTRLLGMDTVRSLVRRFMKPGEED
jgi:hypothetical protein